MLHFFARRRTYEFVRTSVICAKILSFGIITTQRRRIFYRAREGSATRAGSVSFRFSSFSNALCNDNVFGSVRAECTERSARVIARARHRRRTDGGPSRARPKSRERETRERSERRRARTVRGQCSGTCERALPRRVCGFCRFLHGCQAGAPYSRVKAVPRE